MRIELPAPRMRVETWIERFEAMFCRFRPGRVCCRPVPVPIPFPRWIVLLLAFFTISSVSVYAQKAASAIALTNLPPKLPREFRAAWVASNANLDWPSKPGLSVEKQKEELRRLMDKAVELGLNTLILQVRPFCDAFYISTLEPWSIYFSGEMGKGPTPLYDPLKYAVEEAHARGLELHAWFNPYRAGLAPWKYSASHISRKQPQLVRRYDNLLWLDPSEPAVQDHVVRVIMDVVRRYDIDGVHLDDYFYPYPKMLENGSILDFPDSANWNKYRKAGGKMERAEWRREHVNQLVRRLKRDIHLAKSWVTFGISPFGIWRPGYPQQIKGLDAYEHLYADARKWLVNGWVDYLTPQLYWTIDRPQTSYAALLAWWRQQDEKGIPIWPGGAVTHVINPILKWPYQEILRQINLSRMSASPGYVHWNISALLNGPPAMLKALKTQYYQETALVPANPGDAGEVPKPSLTVKTGEGKHQLTWSVPASQKIAFWILQTKNAQGWKTEILPSSQRGAILPARSGLQAVALSYLSRHRNVSAAALGTF